MEPTASRRTIQIHMSSTRQSAATRALIRSRPLTYRYPRGLESPASASPALRAVYVAVLQTAPFARGSSSCSR